MCVADGTVLFSQSVSRRYLFVWSHAKYAFFFIFIKFCILTAPLFLYPKNDMDRVVLSFFVRLIPTPRERQSQEEHAGKSDNSFGITFIHSIQSDYIFIPGSRVDVIIQIGR